MNALTKTRMNQEISQEAADIARSEFKNFDSIGPNPTAHLPVGCYVQKLVDERNEWRQKHADLHACWTAHIQIRDGWLAHLRAIYEDELTDCTEGIQRWICDRDALIDTLKFFSDEANWKAGGKLDPNSHQFEATTMASNALPKPAK